MHNRGFGLVGVVIAVSIVAVLVFGGRFLFLGSGDEESYIEEKLDAVEQAEEVKNLVEDRNKTIQDQYK